MTDIISTFIEGLHAKADSLGTAYMDEILLYRGAAAALQRLSERTAECRYEAGMYQALYENMTKRAEAAEADLHEAIEIIMVIRLLANKPGDRRMLIDKIYEVATRGSRASVSKPSEGGNG